MFLLSDRSPGFGATEDFVRRRVREAQALLSPDSPSKVDAALNAVGAALGGARAGAGWGCAARPAQGPQGPQGGGAGGGAAGSGAPPSRDGGALAASLFAASAQAIFGAAPPPNKHTHRQDQTFGASYLFCPLVFFFSYLLARPF